MDIALDNTGDLYINENNDFVLIESLKQLIVIKIQWFLGEWKWDPEKGLPYFDLLFVKDPDLSTVEEMISERIFEIDKVISSSAIVTVNKAERTATIRFTAVTDKETIRGEVNIDEQLRSH